MSLISSINTKMRSWRFGKMVVLIQLKDFISSTNMERGSSERLTTSWAQKIASVVKDTFWFLLEMTCGHETWNIKLQRLNKRVSWWDGLESFQTWIFPKLLCLWTWLACPSTLDSLVLRISCIFSTLHNLNHFLDIIGSFKTFKIGYCINWDIEVHLHERKQQHKTWNGY